MHLAILQYLTTIVPSGVICPAFCFDAIKKLMFIVKNILTSAIARVNIHLTINIKNLLKIVLRAKKDEKVKQVWN